MLHSYAGSEVFPDLVKLLSGKSEHAEDHQIPETTTDHELGRKPRAVMDVFLLPRTICSALDKSQSKSVL